MFGGQYSTDTQVCGALTLTKGWNGESVKSVVKGGKSVTTNDVLGAERAVRPLSRTSVSDAKSYEPLKGYSSCREVAPRALEAAGGR